MDEELDDVENFEYFLRDADATWIWAALLGLLLLFVARSLFRRWRAQPARLTVSAAATPAQESPNPEDLRGIRLRRLAASSDGITAASSPAPAHSTPEVPNSATGSSIQPATKAAESDRGRPSLRQSTGPSSPARSLSQSSELAKQTASPLRQSTGVVIPPTPKLSPEQVVHNIIAKILDVDLSAATQQAQPNEPFHLNNLLTELKVDAETVPLLSEAHIDSILLERLTAILAPTDKLSYLKKSFDSLLQEQKRMALPGTLFGSLTSSLTTQVGLVLMDNPDQPLLRTFLYADEASMFMMSSMAKHFDVQTLQNMLTPTLSLLCTQLSAIDVTGQWMTHLQALELVCISPSTALILTRHPNWDIPEALPFGVTVPAMASAELTNAHKIRFCFLGAITSMSVYSNHRVADRYFPVGLGESGNSREGLKHLNTLIHIAVSKIYNALLSHPDTRQATIKWICQFLAAGRYRATMAGANLWRRDPRLHEFDGPHLTLNNALLRVCRGFLSDSKVKLINAKFCTTKTIGLKLYEETMIAPPAVTAAGAADAAEPEDLASFGNVTPLFFLTHYSLHIGFTQTIEHYSTLLELLRRMKEELERYQMFRGMGIDPTAAMQATHDKLKSLRLTMDIIQEKESVLPLLEFYGFTSRWLSSLISQGSSELASVPQFILEDCASAIKLIAQLRLYRNMEDLTIDPAIIEMFIVVIGAETIRSPHTKANMVNALLLLTRPDLLNSNIPSSFVARLVDPLQVATASNQKLLPGLLQLYVDCERTGQPGEFYSKFHIRYEISLLLQHLTTLPVYKDAWANVFKQSDKLNLYFLNMVINDSIYLLDELLAKLPNLHDTTVEMQTVQWMQQDQDTREERESTHRHEEGIANTNTRLSTKSLQLLLWMTRNDVATFKDQEMTTRIAVMLNYFLVHLVGPKKKNLKVAKGSKLEFHPSALLTLLVNVYNNLFELVGEQFVTALVADERSFNLDIFKAAHSLLDTKKLTQEDDIRRFGELIKAVEVAGTNKKAEDDLLTDMPDDFADPLMNTLMTDPVKLPSGYVVDRATIMRHLMSNPTDPFTRAALKPEMLVPDVELKQKVDEWLASKRQK